MGNKEAKPPAASRFNYHTYGFTNEEGEALEKYFNKVAGKDHKLDHDEFYKIYIHLNPEAKNKQAKEAIKKAFTAADFNHDGHITLDEFLAFYVMHKSPPKKISQNMKTLINIQNSNTGFITPNQAENYAVFAHNFYNNPSDAPHPRALAHELAKKYGQQIPVNDFVDELHSHHHHRH